MFGGRQCSDPFPLSRRITELYRLGNLVVLFTDLIAAAERENDALRIPAPDDWKQGRTLYGGLTSGACLHAARELAGEARRLRSALISFVGPSSDEIVARAETLRSGRTAATVRASLMSDGAPATEALLTFSDSRESTLDYVSHPAPNVAVPHTDNVIDTSAGGGPTFISNFELIPAGGGIPMSGAEPPDLVWWCRHKDPAAWHTDLGLMCIGDVLPPAALVMATNRTNLSSMTWMIDIVADDLTSEDGWYLFQSRAETVQNGFSTQDMSIWNRNGDLVAKGRQTITIFG